MKLKNVEDSFLKVSGKIQSNDYISSISHGLMSTMPLMMVGAIGSIFNQLGIPAYQKFLQTSGLKKITVLPNEIGTNLFALFAVFAIAYAFAKKRKHDGLTAGILGLMAFLFVTPLHFSKTGAMDAIPVQWLGASGLFTAMILGCLVARVYCLFIDKHIVIKLPDSVPPIISRSFGAILPGLVIGIVAMALSYGFSLTSFQSLHGFIYKIIAQPLTMVGSTFPALIIAVLAVGIFWALGIHGTMVALSVFYPVWASIDMRNLAAYNAGQPAFSIVSMQFFFLCAFAGGAGNTLGLILNMFTSKVKSNRVLAKLAIVPGLFGINEPIIFGIPIVMNLTLLIPFVFGPVITTVIGYILVKIGWLAAPTGIASITGAPIIINQFFQGGWTWAIWEAVIIVLSYLMYMPFFKMFEKEQLKNIASDEEDEKIKKVSSDFDKATK